MHVVSTELAHDPTIDITTIGRTSGQPRRIEIWMMDVDGRYFIAGTPGRRDWLANVRANPRIKVHLKQRAALDLAATATPVTDATTRRRVLERASATWYRAQRSLDDLNDTAPIIEELFG